MAGDSATAKDAAQYNAKLKCSIETICTCSCTLSFLLNSELQEYDTKQAKKTAFPTKESSARYSDKFLNPHYTFDTLHHHR